MQSGDTIVPDRQSALSYDEQARKTDWFVPEVVFGLAYEYVQAGEKLLDLGIGSGLSSLHFHKVGLQIYGLDGSDEILEVCAQKGFTVELKKHDLRQLPLPYASHSFDHIISVGVLNSFQDLGQLFGEIRRMVREHGIFAFTVEDQEPDQEDSYAINRVEVSEAARDETAVTLFRHPTREIKRLLEENGFTLLKALKFVAFEYPAENRAVYFKAYVARHVL